MDRRNTTLSETATDTLNASSFAGRVAHRGGLFLCHYTFLFLTARVCVGDGKATSFGVSGAIETASQGHVSVFCCQCNCILLVSVSATGLNYPKPYIFLVLCIYVFRRAVTMNVYSPIQSLLVCVSNVSTLFSVRYELKVFV